MTRIFLAIICVLPHLCVGQYTYFNTYMPAPNTGTAGGFCGHLFVQDNMLWTLGLYNDISNFQRTHYQLNLEGNLISQVDFDLPDLGFFFMQLSDAVQQQPDGSYLSAVGFEDESHQLFPKVISYNEDWTEDWTFELHDFDNDEFVLTSEYHFVIESLDGSFIAAGNVGMDTIPGEIGDTSGDFIMTKFEQNGTIVWNKHYPFHDGAVLPFSPFSVRTSDIFELPNGDILVWGAWYHDWDPMVLRFDSEGIFISEKHWGHPLYDDWLPWPIQLTDSTFLFAYSRGTGVMPNDGPSYTKPSVGIFNSNQMEVVSSQVYEHELYGSFIIDFEKVNDDLFVLMGYGYDGISMGYTYMQAVDSQGNELWFNQYIPPVEYYTAQGADLEVTPDGGLAFVGNFFLFEGGVNVTWIVKTDACGDEVFNGCPVGIDERHPELVSGSFQLAPNPASNIVHLSSEHEFESITITDITGKDVHTCKMQNHVLQTQVDVSMLAKGLYLVVVDFGNNVISAKRLAVE